MKAPSANLLRLIKGPKQFVIPIYQRTYRWQVTQCEKLLKYIIRISKNLTIPGHFIVSIMYFQEGIHTVSDVPELFVTDNLHRLDDVVELIEKVLDKHIEAV